MTFPQTQFAGLSLIDYVNGATPQEFFKESDATQWDAEIIALTQGLRDGQFRLVFNDTGALIEKGKPVKLGAFNVANSAPVVSLAQADDEANFSDGVALADIAIAETGIIVKRNVITGLNTNAFTVLDDIFLDAAAPGVLVNVAPANVQRLGRVTVKDAATGQIEFDVERGAGGNLTADGTTLENAGGVLRVKALGIDSAELAALAVTTAKLASLNVTRPKLELTQQNYRLFTAADEVKANDAMVNTAADLVIVGLAVGKYWVRAVAFVTQAAGVAGFVGRIGSGGGGPYSLLKVTETGIDNKTFNGSGDNEAHGTVNLDFPFDSMAAGDYVLEFEGFLDVANAGDLSFQWSQETSDAGNVTLLRGSYLEVKPLA